MSYERTRPMPRPVNRNLPTHWTVSFTQGHAAFAVSDEGVRAYVSRGLSEAEGFAGKVGDGFTAYLAEPGPDAKRDKGDQALWQIVQPVVWDRDFLSQLEADATPERAEVVKLFREIDERLDRIAEALDLWDELSEGVDDR